MCTPNRLVVVDDEPIILSLLVSIFDEEPWEVVACSDGETALASMRSDGVDVLLTDKNLPDIGGLELLREAKGLQPDCEGIIVTGYASLDTVLAAMQLDAFDYIIKPPNDIFDIQRKVRQAFSKIELGRKNAALMAQLQQQNQQLQDALTELRSVQDELIQSEKLAGIGTLAAGIAHEISSPLFGVMGLAEAIPREQDKTLVDNYASEIVSYSRTIKEIVGQLQGYSRSTEGEYQTSVELHSVVDDAVRLVTRTKSVADGVVEVEVEQAPVLLAKTGEIQQVFVNLVKNAIEAVQEHRGGLQAGDVRIRLWQDDHHVRATVADRGEGIAESRRASVFDPFFTTKPPGKGTGLGLNIVYRIVTRYRGAIAIEDAPSGGAQFTLRFPRRGVEA